MALQFVSLFTGIGGLDYGLEVAGLRCVAQVEIDEYCRKVLARHWPAVPKFPDVRKFTRRAIDERVDLIVGGFPCQDISCAGHKVGITGERSGLWKEMLRAIRAFRPPYALVENVPALRSRGLDVVLADLAACGFDAEWDCIPAATFGAHHIRDRIFILAYARRLGPVSRPAFGAVARHELRKWVPAEHRRTVEIVGRRYRSYSQHLRMGNGSAAWMDRVKACGNAVYWPVARWLGKQIIALDKDLKGHTFTEDR